MKTDPRIAARRLRRFTVAEFARFQAVGRYAAKTQIEWLLGHEIVRQTKEMKKHGGPGRPARVYAYVEIPATPVRREKRKPPEVEATERFKASASHTPVLSRKVKIPNAGMRALVAEARKVGWTAERSSGGHFWLCPPNGEGERLLLSASPSDHRGVLNARAMMRRQGVPV